MTKEQVIFYGEFFKELGLSELKVVNRDEELYLKKDNCGTNNAIIESSKVSCKDNNASIINDVDITNEVVQENISNIVVENTSNSIPVNAPLVGIYYAKPSPSAEPFVKVGDYVNKGDVLCIIEAMKMFNEIKAEVSGRVEAICVNNGDVVEFGQTIMTIV